MTQATDPPYLVTDEFRLLAPRISRHGEIVIWKAMAKWLRRDSAGFCIVVAEHVERRHRSVFNVSHQPK